MTAIQMKLNAELFGALQTISSDEGLMKKAVRSLKRIASQKQAKEDPTLMTKEEFFAKIERAEKEIAEGKGITFTNRNDMNAWLNSL
jgi:hypothetical protein